MNKLSVCDVAKICETYNNDVCRWIKAGYLKASKDPNGRGRFGGSYVINEADLKAFMASDNYPGHPGDILRSRPFNRTPLLEECYPVNLLIACLETPIDSETEVFDIWSYDMRKFENLVTMLTDRERRVLELRYQLGLSLDEAGKALNLTKERVRQIQKKAERKLKYRIITGGVKIITHEQYDALKREKLELETKIRSLEIKLDIYKTKFGEPDENADSPINSITEVKLEELDWSVRAYNCLKRAGFNTLGDILYFDQNQGHITEPFRMQSWLRIRNLGRKSLMEIANVVFNYCGYRLQNWDEENKCYTGVVPLERLSRSSAGTLIYKGE